MWVWDVDCVEEKCCPLYEDIYRLLEKQIHGNRERKLTYVFYSLLDILLLKWLSPSTQQLILEGQGARDT